MRRGPVGALYASPRMSQFSMVTPLAATLTVPFTTRSLRSLVMVSTPPFQVPSAEVASLVGAGRTIPAPTF